MKEMSEKDLELVSGGGELGDLLHEFMEKNCNHCQRSTNTGCFAHKAKFFQIYLDLGKSPNMECDERIPE